MDFVFTHDDVQYTLERKLVERKFAFDSEPRVGYEFRAVSRNLVDGEMKSVFYTKSPIKAQELWSMLKDIVLG